MSDHHHDDENGENELERLLRLAVEDATYRPAFYNSLMSATVYVLGSGVDQNDESTLDLVHWNKQDGSSTLPFFSSLTALNAAVENKEQPYVSIATRTLFEMVKGKDIFLNPKADFGKEFFAEEVAQLLLTGGVQQPEQTVIEEGAEILMGAVETQPTEMLEALTKLFLQRKPVRRAFLATMHDTEFDEESNLLIGLQIDGDEVLAESLVMEAGSVASEFLGDDEPVDFCIVQEGEKGVSHYLLSHVEPFYQRRFGSWLRNTIPIKNIEVAQ